MGRTHPAADTALVSVQPSTHPPPPHRHSQTGESRREDRRRVSMRLLRALLVAALPPPPEAQMVPVMVSSAMPGVTVHTPVTGLRTAVPAGTVIAPGRVVKAPVSSL